MSIRLTWLFLLLASTFNPVHLFAQNEYPLDFAGSPDRYFSTEKLDTLTAFLEQSGSSSLMILHDGKVIYEWGDTEKKHLIHSIRKAILNSLYGIYISNGTIDTTLTLEQLGIDDIEPSLSTLEKSATIADLLRSRSGIYHPAAAVSEGMLRNMPQRGSHRPNETYFYNNWDFNVLGHILEEFTGESLYDLFNMKIAGPLGMEYSNRHISVVNPQEDWQIPDVDGFYQYETNKSLYPAFHFRLSARDMALYGQLYLDNGQWNGTTLIPKEWIDASTQPYSVTNKNVGIAYGMLWNVLMETESRKSKSYYHTGVGIHMLGIYPSSKVVLIHRVDTEKKHSFQERDFYRMISLVWDSKL